MNKRRTVETPIALLHSAMNSSARLSERIRRSLQRELRQIERELRSAGLQPGRRMEMLDGLVSIMAALDKSTTESAKLLRGAPPIPSDDSVTSERILAELTNGKTRVG